MALVKCPECGKQVSDKANSCPNCGYPISHYIETMQESNNTNTVFPENISVKNDFTVTESIEEVREQTAKTENKIKKKGKISGQIWYFLIPILTLAIVFGCYLKASEAKRNLSNSIKKYCTEAGLNEVDVTLEQLGNPGTTTVSYTAEINSDDFSKLKESEMLDFFENLSTIEDNHKFFIYTSTIVNCNNDKYTFKPEVQSQKTPLTVIKNGEILYEAKLTLPQSGKSTDVVPAHKGLEALSRNEKLYIVLEIIRQEDKIGENISEEQETEILNKTAEIYNLTVEDLMILQTDTDLLHEAYMRIADGEKNTDVKSNNSNTSITPKTEDPKEKKRQIDAWVCAEDIVLNNLKSPSTAKFCKYPEATITYSGDSNWTISGWVDAQNSYGATIRTKFLVTLTLTEKGYKNGYVIFDE